MDRVPTFHLDALLTSTVGDGPTLGGWTQHHPPGTCIMTET